MINLISAKADENPSALTWDKILNNLMAVKQYFFWDSKMASLTELTHTFSLAFSFSVQQESQEDTE